MSDSAPEATIRVASMPDSNKACPVTMGLVPGPSACSHNGVSLDMATGAEHPTDSIFATEEPDIMVQPSHAR